MNSVTTVYVEVEHLGGPFDGAVQSVEAGEDGTPPELYLLDHLTPLDLTASPLELPVGGDIATQFYRREERDNGDGTRRWVYVWSGEDIHGVAA